MGKIMTPQQAAANLVAKFYRGKTILSFDQAKKFAEIAADEVRIQVTKLQIDSMEERFWYDVIQEIDKLQIQLPAKQCTQCDGFGDNEGGGVTMFTTCNHCNGTGLEPKAKEVANV